MPKKKVQVKAAAQDVVVEVDEKATDAEILEAVKLTPPKVTSFVACGHVNKQHHGYDGKLEDLACELTKGHTGDHNAHYKRKVGTPVTNEKGIVTSTAYHEEESLGAWSDAAGVPSNQVKVGIADQMTLYQRDLVMQVLQKSPRMKIDDAIEKAKQSQEWNQGSV